ncbi:hypothetical protein [Mariniblastus fucicola]|uniref:Lipoprotein n=1 Tax=Mariniblastus fucicola TaxID=980251 RepID=A0A5B9PQP3_9BACT|nr:hypothetical protein [Mariniblastus fucicola]QEG24801.1 hypothetical protein MFFC18_47240 [Mariniblastus fucicola]
MKRIVSCLLALVFVVAGCSESSKVAEDPADNESPEITTRSKPVLHPVFHTRVTGQPARNPALKIDIHSDWEAPWNRAEFFLSVQSSRFPEDVRILLPVNIGNFAGCKTRFVQLPFEIHQDETLVFELLDDDSMSVDQQKQVVTACSSTGFVIVTLGSIVQPELTPFSALGAEAGRQFGKSIIEDIKLHKFSNYGKAEFRVGATMPHFPHDANDLSVLCGNYCYATLRIYCPPTEIPFKTNEIASK